MAKNKNRKSGSCKFKKPVKYESRSKTVSASIADSVPAVISTPTNVDSAAAAAKSALPTESIKSALLIENAGHSLPDESIKSTNYSSSAENTDFSSLALSAERSQSASSAHSAESSRSTSSASTIESIDIIESSPSAKYTQTESAISAQSIQSHSSKPFITTTSFTTRDFNESIAANNNKFNPAPDRAQLPGTDNTSTDSHPNKIPNLNRSHQPRRLERPRNWANDARPNSNGTNNNRVNNVQQKNYNQNRNNTRSSNPSRNSRCSESTEGSSRSIFAARLPPNKSDDVLLTGLQQIFKPWAEFQFEINISRHEQQDPDAFVQFKTVEQAMKVFDAVKNNDKYTWFLDRRIKYEMGKSNRTIFISPKETIPEAEIQPYLGKFGEIEELTQARQSELTNSDEFQDDEWFVKFAVRKDAIQAFKDETFNSKWKVTLCQNLRDDRNKKINKQTILVRNLPDDTPDEFFREHFEKHGTVQSVTKIKPFARNSNFVIVKFEDEKEAEQAAFKENGATVGDVKLKVKQRAIEMSCEGRHGLRTPDPRVPAAPYKPPTTTGNHNLRKARFNCSTQSVGNYHQPGPSPNYLTTVPNGPCRPQQNQHLQPLEMRRFGQINAATSLINVNINNQTNFNGPGYPNQYQSANQGYSTVNGPMNPNQYPLNSSGYNVSTPYPMVEHSHNNLAPNVVQQDMPMMEGNYQYGHPSHGPEPIQCLPDTNPNANSQTEARSTSALEFEEPNTSVHHQASSPGGGDGNIWSGFDMSHDDNNRNEDYKGFDDAPPAQTDLSSHYGADTCNIPRSMLPMPPTPNYWNQHSPGPIYGHGPELGDGFVHGDYMYNGGGEPPYQHMMHYTYAPAHFAFQPGPAYNYPQMQASFYSNVQSTYGYYARPDVQNQRTRASGAGSKNRRGIGHGHGHGHGSGSGSGSRPPAMTEAAEVAAEAEDIEEAEAESESTLALTGGGRASDEGNGNRNKTGNYDNKDNNDDDEDEDGGKALSDLIDRACSRPNWGVRFDRRTVSLG